MIDLSRKTNSEVAKFISETKDKNICARVKVTQLDEQFEYNEASKIKNLKYAAVAASILLASNAVGQEKTQVKTEISALVLNTEILGKVAYVPADEKEVSIKIKGKLLEAKTQKPFNNKSYSNLVLTINSESASKINPKTGEFSIPVKVLKESKTIQITITGDDYYLSKTIPFDIKLIKNNVLLQNIIIASEELQKIMIAGGLGINYNGR